VHAVDNRVLGLVTFELIEHDVRVFDDRADSTLDHRTGVVVAGSTATHNVEAGGSEAGEVRDCQRRIVGLDDKTEAPTLMVPMGLQHESIAPHERPSAIGPMVTRLVYRGCSAPAGRSDGR
jgi:hypothetical protein